MHIPPNQTAPARARLPKLPALSPKLKLALMIAGGIVGVFVVALIAVNLLISADWVRDRIASRIKEQTGRELTVNGTTALLFTPNPHVVITEATLTDPEARAGTADVAIGRLELDLAFSQLLSRQVDADRVVLVRPILTLRLGKDTRPRELRAKTPANVVKTSANADKPEREVRLQDVRIEDGTVDIIYDEKGTIYDEKGTERRIEHIDATVSLPALSDPLTATGKFVWKHQPVDFGVEVTALADLRAKRPARVVVSLDNPAIAARFEGDVMTKPEFSGHGDLSAKVHSIPSLLAWMREKPPAATAIGDGELASKLVWTEQEVTFSEARFALEHARGQGQAVVTLQSPRPYVRAALALDHLDLNPFLAANGSSGKSRKSDAAEKAATETAAPPQADSDETASSSAEPAKKSWFVKPSAGESGGGEQAAPEASAKADQSTPPDAAEAAPAERAAPVAPAAAPVAPPAAFDADVNLNVRQTRIAHLELGPSSLGIGFRDGILTATLGGMELYDGRAVGKVVIDAAKPIPTFTGNFRLDGVQAKTLLSDAAQFSMVEGKTKLDLQLNGTGSTGDEIKSSLQGQGNVVISDGAIDGIDLTSMISSIGEGQSPNLRQGPGAKTEFSDLGGSFTISNGVMETDNLKMTSPLLQVAAAGKVDLTQSTIDMLANSEIVAGEKGKGGANDLAGLSVPVRIEGPLDSARIRPELKGMFANPEQANKTVKQIGEAIQKKFKGKPVGEAIGRLLGNIQIGPHGGDSEGADTGEAETPPAKKKQSSKSQQPSQPQAQSDGDSGNNNAAPDEPEDPDIQRILR
jgi:AsmA protein